MPSLNYFPDGEAIREFFEPAVKSPSIPLCKRGMTTDSPLWPLARRASDPEGKGELEGIFLKLWLNWGLTMKSPRRWNGSLLVEGKTTEDSMESR